jgi:hypothetical protein
VAAVITRYILKFIQLFFSDVGKGNLHFECFYQEWAEPTYKLVRILVLVFNLIVIFPYLPGSAHRLSKGSRSS